MLRVQAREQYPHQVQGLGQWGRFLRQGLASGCLTNLLGKAQVHQQGLMQKHLNCQWEECLIQLKHLMQSYLMKAWVW